MSYDENAKKRMRHDKDAAPSSTHVSAGDGKTTASCEIMMAKMTAMLAQNSTQMARMQNEMDSMKVQLKETASIRGEVTVLEISCENLEERCCSLGRSVAVLLKSQKWEYSAPRIPQNYWILQGQSYIYANALRHFLSGLKKKTCNMRYAAMMIQVFHCTVTLLWSMTIGCYPIGKNLQMQYNSDIPLMGLVFY